jgi:hypothetical protein
MHKFIKIQICVELLLLFNLHGYGQANYGVVHSYAFSKEIFPGILPIDIRGKSVVQKSNISNIIFLETTGNRIFLWKNARKDGKLFGITATEIKQDTVNLGKTRTNEDAVIILSEKGDRLFRLDLYPKKFSEKDSSSLEIETAGKIILTGEYKDKKITLEIDHQRELLAERRE